MATAKKTTATKAPAKTTAVTVKKPSGGAVVDIKARLAELANKAADSTGNTGGGKTIRVSKDKMFLMPDGSKHESIDVVIVDFVSKNNFYEGKFDSKNPSPPVCFAIGEDPKNMTPSNNSPKKQNDTCQGCPMNEFGSDGNGKACKNQRVLAVTEADKPDGDILLLPVSPTAVKGVDAYVKTIAKGMQLPPVGVITTVSMDETVDYQKVMLGNPQPNPHIEEHLGRMEEAKTLLMEEPDLSTYEAKPGSTKAKAAAVRRR